jgi:CRP-like cAMP-binding protein
VCRGDIVGELTVLTDTPTYDSDAVCVRDCELVNISVESFRRIIALFPKVLKRLSDTVSKRHMQVGWTGLSSVLLTSTFVCWLVG